MSKIASREKYVELARELIDSGLIEEELIFSSMVGLAFELDAEGVEPLVNHISEDLGIDVSSVYRFVSREQKPHKIARAIILQVIIDRFSS